MGRAWEATWSREGGAEDLGAAILDSCSFVLDLEMISLKNLSVEITHHVGSGRHVRQNVGELRKRVSLAKLAQLVSFAWPPFEPRN